MSLSDIKFIVAPTSSLGYGSFINQEDLMFYTEGKKSYNFPFGKSEKDYLKFEIYDFDGNLISSSLIYSKGTKIHHSNSYYDIFNQFIEYSYSEYQSDWVIVGSESSSLFFDISKEFNKLELSDGNYKIYMELGRNVIGNEKSSDNKLIINSISTDRTEVTVIPKTLKGTTSTINTEYDLFLNNQTQLNEVADDLNNGLSKPEIYNIYSSTAAQDATGSAYLKYYYSFKTDADITAFLNDIYYGVKKGNVRSNGQFANNDILGIYDQFKNWMYQNYNSGYTFQYIRDYYYSLFVYIIDHELNRITNKKPAEYTQIVDFLQVIYYNNIFFPVIFNIESKHNTDLSGYFKYHFNFSNDKSTYINNKKIVASLDPRFYDKLAIKLQDPLPLSVQAGSDIWITTDFAFLPIVQNLYYYTQQVIKTIPLRGPNFLIKIENEGNSTESLSMEDLLEETGSLFTELDKKIKSKNEQIIDTTDYRKFENFVNFSSATFRLDAYEEKKIIIDKLYSEVADLDIKLTSNSTDTFYLKQKSEANSEIDKLESGMDGYERFLYDNPAWYDEHTKIYDGYSSASLYDKQNGNSLINNLPQFLIEDVDQNSDYIKFVGMIGHFFDNISLAAKQYTEKNNISSSPNYGISLDIVGDMLQSLGWDVEISKDNLPLILSSFSKSDFDPESPLYAKAREFSEEERNQIIWKRILNTLPYIYKTKGTEASLNALISCFGVPKNIIKIKEYGGIQNVSDLTDKSLYIIEDVKYEPYFGGSGEYFKLDWTGSAQSFEFNFRFDPSKVNNEGEVFRLANCSNKWVVGVTKERGIDWGRLFLSISGSTTKTIITNRAPVFDGSSYHVMIRRNDISEAFGATASFNSYPTRYDLLLQKSEDDRITFYATASSFLSGSYNDTFEAGSYLYIGNYNQNTSSFGIDPEAFFGNIDDIRVWESPVSDERFTAHTLNRNGYDLETPQMMVSESLYRISFERPVDLYDPVPYGVELNNLAFRNDFPYFYAINFPEITGSIEQTTLCDPGTAPQFPYQFTKKDVRMTMNLPDYGSNKFRSNKINYVEQELSTNLNSETRASYKTSELISVDSNKLGIFFSPSEIQNTEIIKFFGDFPLGDLIGDPSDVYKRSYEKFEKFKQIFYDQGFGTIDYSFFMNVVRFYFDKAMFKYIKGIIPARAKLVDGILIEPSILERPKLASKPLFKENIGQKIGDIDGIKSIVAIQSPKRDAILDFKNKGTATYPDVNQIIFPIEYDQLGFEVYAENGITYYKDEYYRADVLEYKKKYQVLRDCTLPMSAITEQEKISGLGEKFQTVTSSYYKINIAKLPTATEYPITASLYVGLPNLPYFSGSLFFDAGLRGWYDYTTFTPHNIEGTFYGSLVGMDVRGLYSSSFIEGNVFNPGIKISGKYINNGRQVRYSGFFDIENGVQLFEGNIYGLSLSGVRTTYYFNFLTSNSTGSIFTEFAQKTSGDLFGPLGQGLYYRKELSMLNYPSNASLLNGYKSNHYKYSRKQFSSEEINSYQLNPFNNIETNFKWKRGSQNKKTTVDPTTGLLNNTDPVETKTI